MANVQYSLRNTMIENLLGGVEMLLQRQCIYALLHWTICPKYIPLHNMLLFLFYIFAKTKCKIIHLHNRHAFWHIYSMSFFVWQQISIVIVHKINTITSSQLQTQYIYNIKSCKSTKFKKSHLQQGGLSWMMSLVTSNFIFILFYF